MGERARESYSRAATTPRVGDSEESLSYFVFRYEVCRRALYVFFVLRRWHSSRDCDDALWFEAVFNSRGDNELFVDNTKS